MSYRPIEDHGAIGNLRTVALVGRDGSIDWWCLPDLDSPSVFGALLDHDRGGRFRLAPARARGGSQRYLEYTNVLETTLEGPHGRLVITDCMPVHGSLEATDEPSVAEPAVVRILAAEGGSVDVEVEWSPRFHDARSVPRMMRTEHGFLAWSGDDACVLAGPPDGEVLPGEDGPSVRSRFELRPGERRALVTRWGADPVDATLEAAEEAQEATVAAWRDWTLKEEATGERAWAGPYAEQVIRSELALKLLAYADTGAIAAAATTSLPEEIGGVRNWDYRMAWIRDAALAAQALDAMGHRGDAEAFIHWAERAAQTEGDEGWGLRILYGLHGQEVLAEEELPHLEGYRRSSPVRRGNDAADQLQLDVYGELISAAYEMVRLGGGLAPEIRGFLPHVADQACAMWREPDEGIWEVRNGPFHHVYSKVMVWMALDRAIHLAEEGVIEGDVHGWAKHRDEIRREVLDRGFDQELGAFAQSYERPVLDASNLLLPLQEFLPFDDPRVQATIDRTIEELTEEGLVFRYKADDGVAGGEGAFGLCTFWLADALALSDRMDEAYGIFEGMLARGNHVGLYSEQIDPSSGAFLGNFPQAFTHLGLINSALYLAHQEGRETPVPAPIGSSEHRSRRARSGGHPRGEAWPHG